jgi:transmembrane secretion effector
MKALSPGQQERDVPVLANEQQQVKGLLRTFVALRHRNFRLFWFGQLISLTGTWMQSIGQAWLVLELTHSAWLLGVVGALQFLPVASDYTLDTRCNRPRANLGSIGAG